MNATCIQAGSLNVATVRLARLLDPDTNYQSRGAPRIVSRRGQRVSEMPGPTTVALTRPCANTLLLAGRRNNPWVSLAEFPWLMAGRNDVAWLEPYLPRARDFSDDGRTWRAGYGPRLRAWDGGHPGTRFDQVARVVRLLHQQPDTRQAVVTLWDPLADLAPTYRNTSNGVEVDMHDRPFVPNSAEFRYKDYPCTNWLHFQLADDCLDLTVVMRSNDLVWGLSGVNVLNFTLLQELVAACLGKRVGTYYHVADNLHSYERHWPMLHAVAANKLDLYDVLAAERHFPWPLTSLSAASLDAWTKGAHQALRFVQEWRATHQSPPSVATVRHRLDAEPWLVGWAYFMGLHMLLGSPKAPTLHEVNVLLEGVARADWRLAACAYLARHGVRRGWWSAAEARVLTQRTAAYTAGRSGAALRDLLNDGLEEVNVGDPEAV